MSKLKPCPFCGSKAKIDISGWDGSDGYTKWYQVICAECEATLEGGFTKQQAIDAWNRRVKDE